MHLTQTRPRVRPSFPVRLLLEPLEDRLVPGFLAPLAYDVGSSPYSVVTADFNNDTILDLAVANYGSWTVSVLLGNGDGTFGAAREFYTGNGPQSVAVGDFNSDGWLDLATANYQGDDVSILLGHGDGTFQLAVNFSAGTGPRSVAVADFNGDGWLDLAVANSGSSNVSILLGNGDGTFQGARNFDAGHAGSRPVSVSVGDVNGDGRLDLAVANEALFPWPPGSLGVLLGNGDGTFGYRVILGVVLLYGFGPQSVVLGDVNGDKMLDLALAINSGLGDNVWVLLGNGDGTFQAARYFAGGSQPQSVAMADVNRDSRLDLVVAGSPGVSVLLGNGNGTFGIGAGTLQTARNFATGSTSRSVVLGDFNGDHVLDVGANLYGNNVGVLLGHGDGTFQAVPHFAAGNRPLHVGVGDLNNDGILDLAVANDSTNSGVSVLLGHGDGTFQAARNFAVWTRSMRVVLGDLNGDGFLDVVAAHRSSDGISVLLGHGDGTFGAFRIFNFNPNEVRQLESLALGDLDGDHILDLAVAFTATDNVRVLFGNGDGSFRVGGTFAAGMNPSSVVLGDLNGDGFLDLAVANNLPVTSTVSVFLGHGDGTFGAARQFAAGAGPGSVALGDVNGDGLLDLAVANVISNNVSVLLGNGDGTFQGARNFAAGREPLRMVLGDVNGDKRLDVVVSYATVRVLLGNGDGTFETTNVSYVSGGYSSLALGDFNGDTFADAVTTNTVNNHVSILLNNRASPCPEPGRAGVVGCDTGPGGGGDDSTGTLLGVFPPEPASPGFWQTQPAAAASSGTLAIHSASAAPPAIEHASVIPAPDDALPSLPRRPAAALALLDELFAGMI